MWDYVDEVLPNRFNHLPKLTTRYVREGIESPQNPKFVSKEYFEKLINDNKMLTYTIQ